MELPTITQRSTDVLIVGAGPAGLMAAITLARYGIDFNIIDKSPVRVAAGHASAFQPRTQEILQTLNLLHELDQRGHRHTNTAFWQEDKDGLLKRTSRSREVVHKTPYPYVFNTDQGICEEVLAQELRKRGHNIFRPFELVDIEYTDDESESYPLRAHILNVGSQNIETWAAKYILGTDGARSATRTAMGFDAFKSQGGEHVWAVADVLVKTDFPDHRCRVVTRTKRKGGCMLIPRKDNGIRIFTQLTEADAQTLEELGSAKANHPRQAAAHKSAQMLQYIQQHVSELLQPYTMEITGVLWQSYYRVRQRLSNKFRDERGRVFILGDACHTHSPKAGQGLNISVQDSYNLTWKLALVLKGLAREELLATYEMERKHIAQQLIDFDVKFAGAFAGVDEADAAVMHKLWDQHHGFTSGLQHCYPENLLVVSSKQPVGNADFKDGAAVEPLTAGKRLLPASGLVRSIDGNIINLLDEMPSNGRFHIFMFSGDCEVASAAYSQTLLDLLHSINGGPCIPPFEPEDITHTIQTNPNERYLIDVFLIHTQDAGEDFSYHGLAPEAARLGFPGRMYGDQGGTYHREVGVSRSSGALVLVRPDTYVSLVTSLDMAGVEELGRFLAGILVSDNACSAQNSTEAEDDLVVSSMSWHLIH